MDRSLAIFLFLLVGVSAIPVRAQQSVDTACEAGASVDACWDRMVEQTLAANAAGEREDAVAYADAAYAVAQANFAEDDERIAVSLANMGLVRDGEQAVAYYRAAIELMERVSSDTTLAIAHRNLAIALFDMARLAEAEGAFAASAGHSLAAEDYPHAVRAMIDVATVCRVDGRHAEAEKALDRALELAEAHLGERSQAYASVLWNYGRNYNAQARYEEAKIYLDRALALATDIEGPDSPMVAQIRQSLLTVLNALGDKRAAEQLAEIARLRAALPIDRPQALQTQFDVAARRFLDGDATAIEDIIAIAGEFASLPRSPPAIELSIARYTAIFLHLAGRHEEETTYRNKALIAARQLPRSNPDRMSIQAEIALGHFDEGNYAASVGLLRVATAELLDRFASEPSSPALDRERRRKGSYFEYFVRSAWFAASSP